MTFALICNARSPYGDNVIVGGVLSTHRTAEAARRAEKRRQTINTRANPGTTLAIDTIVVEWIAADRSSARGVRAGAS